MFRKHYRRYIRLDTMTSHSIFSHTSSRKATPRPVGERRRGGKYSEQAKHRTGKVLQYILIWSSAFSCVEPAAIWIHSERKRNFHTPGKETTKYSSMFPSPLAVPDTYKIQVGARL
ncbi:hypothetical protein LSH36_82g01030 [Paralvinella palmiformis]|uniref:Uncharacterized protein n=1 Tax=Paralvinella palmiformis TaxID=53620 RepID=A0AAD9NDK7_9ANNE|nr:hypothetical protein LSH36_82g01030 [Paralvinella palmiformis]